MAKRRGKTRVRSGTTGTTGTTGTGGVPEQYLTPGTPERERMLQAHQDAIMENDEAGAVPLDAGFNDGDVQSEPESRVDAAYSQAQGVRNYRLFMKKYEQVGKTRGIIEDGLGRSVSMSDLEDELYDPQVSAANFTQKAVEDHTEELAQRMERPVIDIDKDGEPDEPIMTPGMRRMARYM